MLLNIVLLGIYTILRLLTINNFKLLFVTKYSDNRKLTGLTTVAKVVIVVHYAISICSIDIPKLYEYLKAYSQQLLFILKIQPDK